MRHSLRILVVDDSEEDAELLLHALRRGGYQVTSTLVDTPSEMRAQLEGVEWDVITSDHAMPQFSAPEALALAKELCPDVPFIIVSGEIDLNLAVSLMKGGAQDYIQKRELARVVPAIERELREVGLRFERQKTETALKESEDRFRLLFQSMDSGFALHEIICDQQGVPCDYRFLEINPEFERLTGLKAEALIGHTNMEMLPGTEKEWVERYGKVALTGETTRFENYSGELGKSFEVTAYSPKHGQFAVNFRDVTESKRMENALRQEETLLKQMLNFTEELLKIGSEQVTFQKILENLLFISNARFGILTLQNESTGKFTTTAIAGLKDSLINASKLAGFKIVGKEWNEYSTDNEKLKGNIVTFFSSLNELDRRVLPEIFTKSVEESQNIGEVAVIKIMVDNQMIGDFTLMMPEGKHLENDTLVEIYSRQIDMFFTRIKAEKTSRKNEQWHRTILQTAMDGFWMVDLTGKVLEVNETYCRMSGYNMQELLSMYISDLEAIEMSEDTSSHLQKVMEQGQDRFESRHRRKDGSFFDVEVSVQFKANEGGCLFAFLRDISARKQAEIKLHKNEERLRSIFDAMTEGFSIQEVICDDTGKPCDLRFIDANPAFERQTGLKNADTLGHTLLELFPQSEPYWIERYGKVGITGEPAQFEALFGPLNIYYQVNAFQIEYSRFGVLFTDINERKRAEESLIQADERLALAQRAAGAGVWDWDIVTGKLNWSPQFFQLLGLDSTKVEATFDVWRRILHPDDSQQAEERINAASRDHIPLINEYRIIKPTGEMRWINARGDTTYNERGEALRMTGICIDITERKRIEEELRKGEENLRIIFETLSEGVSLNEIVFNDNGEMIDYKILEVNDAFYKIADMPKESNVIGNLATELYKMNLKTIQDFWENHKYVSETTQSEYVSPISNKVFRVSRSPFKNNRFVTSFQDITESKQAEKTLRERESNLAEAQQIAHMGSWEWDMISNTVRWSDEMYRVFDLTPDSYDGLPESLLKVIHPDDVEIFTQSMESNLKNGKSPSLEYRVIYKDGSIHNIFAEGKVEFNEIGKPIRSVCTVQDFTVQKRVEEQIRRLNTELEQRVADRTAQLTAANQELEAFSYSVSHDLRAPLRILEGFSNVLIEDYAGQLDEQGKSYLNDIQDASQRMGQLINDLLKLSRVIHVDFVRQQVDLSMLANRIAVELQAQLPQRRVEIEVTPNLIVQGDGNLLNIVLENLLNNAIKFTGQREHAKIQFGMVEPEGKPVYFVRDNGAGFDMEYTHKLFGAFQRLHSQKEFPGIGIGLATVRRIINRHGGRIWAEGEVEKGATFYFTLGDTAG